MTLNDLLKNLHNSIPIKDDKSLLRSREFTSLKTHISDYDSILSDYSHHVKDTLKSKRKMKKAFFGFHL